MSTLICPKCGAPMREYERRGVTLEQCVECRGVYLDRGELERLTSAGTAHHDDPGRRDRDDGDEYRERREGRRSKRRGFLDEFLDFG